MTRNTKFQLAVASFILGSFSYGFWLHGAETITGSRVLTDFYLPQIFVALAICGKNCEGGLSIASVAACVIVASLEWALILFALGIAYRRFTGPDRPRT